MASICFVVTTPFAVNGFLLGHLRALADFHQVTLCVDTAQYPLSNEIDSRVKVCPVAIARKIAPWNDLGALLRLLGIFRQGRFAAVHSVTPKAGLLAMLAGYICRIPRRTHTFTGQVWATRTGARRFLLKMIDRFIIACATDVLSDSMSQSRLLERELGLKPGRVGLLGSGSIAGVDSERFCPDADRRLTVRAELSAAETDFVFLYVGRLARDKGLRDLIEAFCALWVHKKDVMLWVVGPDEENLTDPLRQLAGEADAAIRWIGATLRPEIFMAAADVLVLPSYREGFGSVIIEAASCGIPVIATRIDGIIDAVADDVTGILVPPGDISALRNGMAALAADPAIGRGMGAAARQRVLQQFTAKAVTGAWLQYYGQRN